MAEVIVTAVIAVFFSIGLYTTAREIWSWIFSEDDESEEPP